MHLVLVLRFALSGPSPPLNNSYYLTAHHHAPPAGTRSWGGASVEEAARCSFPTALLKWRQARDDLMIGSDVLRVREAPMGQQPVSQSLIDWMIKEDESPLPSSSGR